MSKLMRHEARGEAQRVTHLVQVVAELTNECIFGERACQEPSIGRQRIEGAKESETLDERTNKGIYWHHAFRLQFAERHMNRPLIRAGGAETIARQLSALTDAHAGVTNQQKSVTAQIVAAEKFLLEELILLCRERTWQSSGKTRNVLAADQLREFRKWLCPS